MGKIYSRCKFLQCRMIQQSRDYCIGKDVVPCQCHVDAVSIPSRCDPTPISLAGGVLLAAGAFNFACHLVPVLSRLRCGVSRGFDNSYVSPAPMLAGSFGAVSA